MSRSKILHGVVATFLFGSNACVLGQSAPQKPEPMHTRWSPSVSSPTETPYPRPILVRVKWLSLNGDWEFGMTHRDQTNSGSFTDKIVVPFPVESVLSGTKRHFVNEFQRLWYRRKFVIPEDWNGQRILLHFEAVDWDTTVWVNGDKIGRHQGGYDQFTFDITDHLTHQGEQTLTVSVYDPTEAGAQPIGKQMQHPRAPFFHCSSGIWQTVWLEPVPKQASVESLQITPDIDAGVLNVEVQTRGETNNLRLTAIAFDGQTKVSEASGPASEKLLLPIPHAKLWSPENPFLYDLKISLFREGKTIDEITSYFGMRKISVAKDSGGFQRIMLNNKFYFELGPLDQGYWPDGIYTAPTDEALKFDIESTKALGFNMCRKHVKIEPERWYYWCDKLGLLVWQDMPNGDRPTGLNQNEIQRRPESARQFEEELKQMVQQKGNHPCIVTWVIFNQGWGQYDTSRLTDWVKALDPSRLVISASGWHDTGTGDIRSVHTYHHTFEIDQDSKRACVIVECGALGLAVPGHLWGGKGTWNVTYYEDKEKLVEAYAQLISQIKQLKDKKGLSGAVITQLTDVETELDGFMTYDRAVIKMPEQRVRQINETLFQDN
jgi:beta-galactosidase/beta-glucuronidase